MKRKIKFNVGDAVYSISNVSWGMNKMTVTDVDIELHLIGCFNSNVGTVGAFHIDTLIKVNSKAGRIYTSKLKTIQKIDDQILKLSQKKDGIIDTMIKRINDSEIDDNR